MATAKKKPTPAQLEARRLFAERARSGAFAGARKGKAKKPRAAAKRSASPAQLRARAAFTKMVKERAGAKRQSSEVESQKSAKKNSRGFSSKAPAWTKSRKAKRNPLKFKSEAEFQKWKATTGKPRRKATKKRGIKGTVKAIGRNIVRGMGMAHNPRKASKRQVRERKITRAKRQQVLAFKQHGTRKPARRTGPGRLPNPLRGSYEVMGFRKGKSGLATGRRKTVGKVKAFTRWGAQRKATRIGKSKGMFLGATKRVRKTRSGKKKYGFSLFNPSPSSVFSEFRGKGATTKTKVTAATGTPPVLAKLGALRELQLEGGKSLKFGGAAALGADGRKKLHIVGVKMKRPNPPGEIDYGEIAAVTYRADKPHIETGVFDYVHEFGEDGGRRPHLIVDSEGYPVIEGGSYKISSDGIID